MEFGGLQKLSMVDFPGKLAATVFTRGCDLRCPFCHNAPLVVRLEDAEHLTEAEILAFLSRRRGLLDGVVLSGGEPLLHPDAPDFLRRIRGLGFAVKLDTNGLHPDRLADVLAAGLVDYVAMDIKNAPDKYQQTCGMPALDLTPIEESIRLLREGPVDHEFRTTVVEEFHTAEDLLAIGRWLAGSPRYVIQSFVDSPGVIQAGLHALPPAQLQAFADLVRPFFGQVTLRGI